MQHSRVSYLLRPARTSAFVASVSDCGGSGSSGAGGEASSSSSSSSASSISSTGGSGGSNTLRRVWTNLRTAVVIALVGCLSSCAQFGTPEGEPEQVGTAE